MTEVSQLEMKIHKLTDKLEEIEMRLKTLENRLLKGTDDADDV